MKRLKDIYRYLKRRYGKIGNLTFMCLILGFIAVGGISNIAECWHDNRLLAWAYVCSLVSQLTLAVQLLRLDCRRLLSHHTANLLETAGTIILFCTLVRSSLIKRAGIAFPENSVADIYVQDSVYLYVLPILLWFFASIVEQAVRIKEEQDLTI